MEWVRGGYIGSDGVYYPQSGGFGEIFGCLLKVFLLLGFVLVIFASAWYYAARIIFRKLTKGSRTWQAVPILLVCGLVVFFIPASIFWSRSWPATYHSAFVGGRGSGLPLPTPTWIHLLYAYLVSMLVVFQYNGEPTPEGRYGELVGFAQALTMGVLGAVIIGGLWLVATSRDSKSSALVWVAVVVFWGLITYAVHHWGEPRREEMAARRFDGDPASNGTLDRGQSRGRLQVTAGMLAGKRFPITKQGLHIGRDVSKCDVVISDDTVSMHHAWIVPVDGAVVVIDRGSANGTYVNSPDSPRISKIALRNGDRVFIGRKGAAILTYCAN